MFQSDHILFFLFFSHLLFRFSLFYFLFSFYFFFHWTVALLPHFLTPAALAPWDHKACLPHPFVLIRRILWWLTKKKTDRQTKRWNRTTPESQMIPSKSSHNELADATECELCFLSKRPMNVRQQGGKEASSIRKSSRARLDIIVSTIEFPQPAHRLF
jgi:hypothetical protein